MVRIVKQEQHSFCVHIRFTSKDDEDVLTLAPTPVEAVLKVLQYFSDHSDLNSSRRWVKEVSVNWLHTEV